MNKLKNVIHKFGAAGQKLGHTILDYVVPPCCIACESAVLQQGTLCAQCWRGLNFITKPYCAVLGTPFAYDLGPDIISAEAIALEPPFEKARSVVLYDQVARHIVARLKYQDRLELTRPMARLMEAAAQDLFDDEPLIVPVPLHYRRLLSRHYNQSALLARCLAQLTSLDYQPDTLLRVRNTVPQVGLTRKQREDNVRGVFSTNSYGKMRMSGRVVLLVDDVLTTGATIRAASRACLRAGAKAVRVLTFARVSNLQGGVAAEFLEEKAPIFL